MIELREALQILEQTPQHPVSEVVPVAHALGRVLAEDVVSAIEMPPFDKAAMDGYAIHSQDPAAEWEVTGVVAAGAAPGARIEPGQAIRIMTGAPMPIGADQVVIREVSEERQGRVRFSSRDGEHNVCLRGEDLRPGDRVLARGARLGPAASAAAAAVGRDTLSVYRVPRVGVVVTGTEIVPPGETLQPGQIYDSNSASIQAQLRQMGIETVLSSRVTDDRDEIRAALRDALAELDLVILSGGVSMGDFDYVPGVLDSLGVRLHFTQVAIKPGKPTVFGSSTSGFVFGLPGNPVSTFVVFEVMVKPFIYRMMGHSYHPRMITAPMAETWRRSKVRRTAFLPALLRNDRVSVPEYHGSAHVFALLEADCLLEVPAGVGEIRAEETVRVRLLGS